MIETAEMLNNQAVRLVADGNFSDAIACITRAITIESDNYLLWFNLGLTYRDSGNMKEARKSLVKAYELEDEDESVIEMLAIVCHEMGDDENAMGYCLEGLSKNNMNSHLFNTLGVINFHIQQYEVAAQNFETAVIINPYYYDALVNLRDTYEELKNDNGFAECQMRIREIESSGGSN